MAAASPAAYPWFCTSGCIRSTGIASRAALMPRPTTSRFSVLDGRMALYGRQDEKNRWCVFSTRNSSSTVCPCVSKDENVMAMVSGYVRPAITSCDVT